MNENKRAVLTALGNLHYIPTGNNRRGMYWGFHYKIHGRPIILKSTLNNSVDSQRNLTNVQKKAMRLLFRLGAIKYNKENARIKYKGITGPHFSKSTNDDTMYTAFWREIIIQQKQLAKEKQLALNQIENIKETIRKAKPPSLNRHKRSNFFHNIENLGNRAKNLHKHVLNINSKLSNMKRVAKAHGSNPYYFNKNALKPNGYVSYNNRNNSN